jgi:outer membrane protein assembly factor BamB
MKRLSICALYGVALLLTVVAPNESRAADWPVFGGDNARRFISSDTLTFPLSNAWLYQSDNVPVPAFKGMLATYASFLAEPMRMDYAYYPVVASNKVVFAAYADETVVCVDAASGATSWIYTTEGAVRDPVTLDNGKAYFGVDDGSVQCVDLATGALLWKRTLAPEARRIMANGRLGSQWPVRTGIVIDNGTAYAGCGIFTQMGSYLNACNAASGALVYQKRSNYSLLGPILVEGSKVICPSGRASPSEWDKVTGTCLMPDHTGRREGGSSFAGMFDSMVVYGPMETGFLVFRVLNDGYDNGYQTIDGSFTCFIAEQAVAGAQYAYVLRTNEVCAYVKSAFTNALLASEARGPLPNGWRSENRFFEQYESDAALNAWLVANKAWSAGVPISKRLYTMAVAANAVIVGGNGHVTAYDATTGAQLWTAPVAGEARTLAVAGGALYVGTSAGCVYCFRTAPTGYSQRVPAPVNPYAYNAACAEGADLVAANADRTNGVAIVLGAGARNGQLMYELAKRTQFYIIGIENDTNACTAARVALRQAGIYGSRATLMLGSGDTYAVPDMLANVVMSAATLETGALPADASAVMKLVQPYGGTLVLGSTAGALDLSSWTQPEFSAWQAPAGATAAWWRISHRGILPGGGLWSHQFGDKENTACSGDLLIGTNLTFQWFGRPGSEDVFDRHLMPMSPLFHNGKMFISGKSNSLKAMDPYNGTFLWQITVPLSARTFQAMSGGFMCADDDVVYITSSGTCWKVHADSGAVEQKFNVPENGNHWGFIATDRGLVYGTWLAPQATINAYANPKALLNQTVDSARPLVSKGLFAVTNSNGALQWRYGANSVIINQSIVLGDGRIYFAESYSTAAVGDADNCVDLRDFFATNAWLVALDAQTGSELWRRPLERLNPASDGYEHIMYLQFAAPQRVMLSTRTYIENISGKYYTRFVVAGLEPTTGTNLWQKTINVTVSWINTLSGTKSQATSHPTLVNGRLYILPFGYGYGTMSVFDVLTGTEYNDTAFGSAWVNKGCAMRTASATCMYHRHTTIEGYHMASRQKWYVTRTTRPSCWQSVVPAGGLLLMPEGGSECVCGTSLSLSGAMAPAAQETTPPTLMSVLPLSHTNLQVLFSEAVSQATANNSANYTINGGVSVSAAARHATQSDRVTLFTSYVTNGTYTLTVNNIADLLGNVIAPNSTIQFVMSDVMIVAATNALAVMEGGAVNFTVRLSAAPVGSATVSVARISGASDVIVSNGAQLVFSSSNYATPQTVTIAAAEDDDTVNDTAVFQCSAPGLNPVTIAVTEIDNDHGGSTDGFMQFRDGLNGYTGAADTYLYGGTVVNTNYNYGASTTLAARNDSTKRHPIFSWDISALKSDVTITSAVLTFAVSSNPKTAPVEVFALLRPWTEGTGTGAATGDGATWATTDGTTPWQTPGAAGATDRGAVVLGSFSVAATGTIVCTLNTQGLAVVQSWVGHPENNCGFITPGPNESGAACTLHSGNSGTDAVRPMLTLYYTEPAVGPQNASILIDGGALATISAAVTLTLFAENPAPVEMLLSESPSFIGATPQPYQATAPFTLSSPLGLKTVYAQFFDAETDPSDVVSATIELVPEPSACICALTLLFIRTRK